MLVVQQLLVRVHQVLRLAVAEQRLDVHDRLVVAALADHFEQQTEADRQQNEHEPEQQKDVGVRCGPGDYGRSAADLVQLTGVVLVAFDELRFAARVRYLTADRGVRLVEVPVGGVLGTATGELGLYVVDELRGIRIRSEIVETLIEVIQEKL